MDNIDSVVSSPDGQHSVVVYDCQEVRMGSYLCSFALLDGGGVIIRKFEPLSALPAPCAWSEDSRFFAAPVQSWGGYYYFVWDLMESRFAALRVNNPYPLEVRLVESARFVVEYTDSQLRATNVTRVVDGTQAEWPVKRFRKPAPLTFSPKDLTFFDGAELAKVGELTAEAPMHDMSLLPDGFFPFDGRPPGSTTQELNGRQLEGWHLEAFAEYGDPVAEAWLGEIQRKAGTSYDPWEKVSRYLGFRDRP